METAVIASLVGVCGMVLGSLISTPEFRAILGRQKKASLGLDLQGQWLGEWYINDTSIDNRESDRKKNTKNQEKTQSTVVKDIIIINNVEGNQVMATGVSPLMNEYRLTGFITLSNVLTFTFQGTHKQTLSGVVILQLNTLRDELRGHWLQMSPEGKLVGGNTVWKRN